MTLPTADLPTILTILVIGWAGFRWLRSQIRSEFKGEAFRQAVRSESVEALKLDEGRSVIREIVSSAFTGQVEPILGAIHEVRREVKEQDRRIGSLETRVEGLAARVLTQRVDDLKRAGG